MNKSVRFLTLAAALILPAFAMADQCPETVKANTSTNQYIAPAGWSINAQKYVPGTTYPAVFGAAAYNHSLVNFDVIGNHIFCNYYVDVSDSHNGFVELVSEKVYPQAPTGETWEPNGPNGYICVSPDQPDQCPFGSEVP